MRYLPGTGARFLVVGKLLGRLPLLAALIVLATVAVGCEPRVYDLAFFGDMPYSSSIATKYNQMINDLNEREFPVAFHVGDIGPGKSSTCTDAVVDTETARFDTIEKALVYTPGDNEWSDCSGQLARLDYIRETVFRSDGALSRGQEPIALGSDASTGHPENARFKKGPVTIATLHIVGGDDNNGHEEFDTRRPATIAWMRATFAQAKAANSKGVILVAQADPNLSEPIEDVSSDFESMNTAIREEVAAFTGQVLFVNGDGHDYFDIIPIPELPNLRQIQVEGDSKVSYVQVHIDPKGSSLFTITTPRRF